MRIFTLLTLVSSALVYCSRSTVKVTSGNGYSIAMKRLQCSNNTERVLFHACKLKLVRGKLGILSLGFTALRRETTVMLRLRLERKTSANIYRPTVIDVTFNMCEVTKSNKTLAPFFHVLNMFSPDSAVFMGPFIHSCPYEGLHESINVTISRMTVPNFIQTGDVKLICTVSDRLQQPLLEVAAYLYVKTPSLMQIN